MKLYTLSEWIKRKGTPFFKNVEEEGVELMKLSEEEKKKLIDEQAYQILSYYNIAH